VLCLLCAQSTTTTAFLSTGCYYHTSITTRSRECFSRSSSGVASRIAAAESSSNENGDAMDLDNLKAQLEEYLAMRKEIGADELAQKEIGKVVGGTKGNAVLEFVSGAPNKAFVVERAPDALSYGELTKYGYGQLATPVMKAGGRFAMYKLLGLEPPETTIVAPEPTPEIVIDREGKNDPKRYKGLARGQFETMDNAAQVEAFERNLKRKQNNENEPAAQSPTYDYEMPFADKRNTAPRQTPDWTPERLDELGKSIGRAESWAREAKAKSFIKDQRETIDLTLQQRAYSVLTTVLIATAFGKSTDTFLIDLVKIVPDKATATSIKEALQGPAFGLLMASIGSFVYSYKESKEQNRNSIMWAIKGLLGGPFTVTLLRSSDPLITREEDETRKNASR